ncbi:MAG: type I 3-dehydroquinate dehydratase [Thermodesulfobacteriaceae bacterium]|nr:type I 3-dehydroquinate dehydratase [Thermodesulfobacteriaceae bacterium]MCX8041067.1 type I 3-dehydroquinate dehydratase [Thermodesulfobacteriaceae bacterium]MDW8135508.1 type I 3-dehydroquinate dehydratase [Thermodesulfobacterium sp.]
MFCITIAEKRIENVKEKLKLTSQVSSLAEIRADFLEELEVKRLEEIFEGELSLLWTFRSPREGGAKRISEKERLKWIKWALDKNFKWLDVEWYFFKKFKKELQSHSYFPQKFLISYHNFKKTPSFRFLRGLLKSFKKEGIKYAKIVTMVESFYEALKLLELIYEAKEKDISLIAFGMGEKGILSRILCLFCGSPFTYVVLKKEEALAPGQLDFISAKRLYEELKSCMKSME